MIAAIDCDRRISYCVTDDGATGRGPTAWAALEAACRRPDLVLFEIASPVSFTRGAAGHGAMTQLARWALWNVAQAVDLSHRLATCRLLVSPSNIWTKGYSVKTRHAIAGCQAGSKDLRECEAMLWFYRTSPGDWLPLADYLSAL